MRNQVHNLHLGKKKQQNKAVEGTLSLSLLIALGCTPALALLRRSLTTPLQHFKLGQASSTVDTRYNQNIEKSLLNNKLQLRGRKYTKTIE